MILEMHAAKQSDQQKNRWDKKKNYHAVDLDGTLALWSGWRGSTHIGPPVPKMLERVKKWLRKGERVKIFTARVDDLVQHNGWGKEWEEDRRQREAIDAWTLNWVGQCLETTNMKDRWMVDLWDDRAQGVQPNTGKIKGSALVTRLSTKPSPSS